MLGANKSTFRVHLIFAKARASLYNLSALSNNLVKSIFADLREYRL